MEILNRCRDYDERVFYILHAANQHLKVEKLKRCIVNQTFEALMSKDKQMNSALLTHYSGIEYMLKDRVL